MTAERELACPHCGGLNRITPAAMLIHCAYCDSAFTFADDRIMLIGSVAIPAKTESPFYLGQTGTVQGHGFEIRGHLRYRYSTGYWDEWCGVTPDGKVLWISEDEREISLFRREELNDETISFDLIGVGQIVTAAGVPFMVEERDTASLAGFEGEIPFLIATDRTFPYVAGIANEERITLEFGEQGIERYRGRVVTLEYLGITAGSVESNLNHSLDQSHEQEIELPRLNDSALNRLTCGSCGAPIRIAGNPAETVTVICSFCGSSLDAKTSAILTKSTSYSPPDFALPLAASGTLSGVKSTVVGRIRLVEEDWHWDEYLLWCGNGEYRWLIDDNGNWSTSRRVRSAIAELPQDLTPGETIVYQNQKFRVKERTNGTIAFIDGEFPYFTAVGKGATGFDALCGTRIISCEWSQNEIEWYVGDRTSAERIKEVFGLSKIPVTATTDALNRTASWRNAAVITILISLVALVVLQMRQTILNSFVIEQDEYSDSLSDDGFAEREITIPAKGNYLFRYESNLNDNWVFFTTEIQDSAKTPLMQFSSDLSYYSGYEGGESWSEGSRTRDQILSFTQPGRYTLLFTGEHESTTPSVSVTIYKNAFVKRYLILVILVSILIILIDLNKRGILTFESDD